MGEAGFLHHALLKTRLPFHTFAQENINLSSSRVVHSIERLLNFVAERKGNNDVRSRSDIAPQTEEKGAISPTRGFLVAWQENPLDLKCGDEGTTHDSSVPLLRRCETLETQGRDRE